MRFGYNKNEKQIIESLRAIHLNDGIPAFAWWPVKMDRDEDYVWLEGYWKQARMSVRKRFYTDNEIPPFDFEQGSVYKNRKPMQYSHQYPQSVVDYVKWIEDNHPHMLKYTHKPEALWLQVAKRMVAMIST